MMCAPPSARAPIRPSDAWKRIYTDNGINFYQSYFAQPEATTEIMRDLRRFLLGTFYSTSGYCPPDKQWRWAWKSPETFSDTYTEFEVLGFVDHTHAAAAQFANNTLVRDRVANH